MYVGILFVFVVKTLLVTGAIPATVLFPLVNKMLLAASVVGHVVAVYAILVPSDRKIVPAVPLVAVGYVGVDHFGVGFAVDPDCSMRPSKAVPGSTAAAVAVE